MKITLTNDFHNTEATVIVNDSMMLSNSQIKRAQKKLCGMSGCECSNAAGTRGRQYLPDGSRFDLSFDADRNGVEFAYITRY